MTVPFSEEIIISNSCYSLEFTYSSYDMNDFYSSKYIQMAAFKTASYSPAWGAMPTSPAPPRLAPLQEAGCQCDRWKCCKAAVKWPQAAVESPRTKLYQKRPSLGVPLAELSLPENGAHNLDQFGEELPNSKKNHKKKS